MRNLFPPLTAINCLVSPLLPRPQTVLACDIETREVISIETGKLTHAVKIGNDLHCSQEFFNELKEYLEPKTINIL